MKKIWNLPFLFLFFAGILSGCFDDDDDYIAVDDEWTEANSSAFISRSLDDDEFHEISSQSGDGYILYRVIEEGDGTDRIYYTSTVKVYYKGCLICDEDDNIIENLDDVLDEGVVFDSVTRDSGADPAEFTVSSLIDGWATALQHMHVGDRWEIWIPYKLGYGVSGSSANDVTILPYTTLVFDVEVVGIAEQ